MVKEAMPKAKGTAKAQRTSGEFTVGDHVVYPTHGVGLISAIEEQEVAGHQLRLFVIEFVKCVVEDIV